MIRKIARPMLASVYIADGVDTVLNTQAHVEGTQNAVDRLRYVLPRKYAQQIPNDPELITRAVGGAKIGAGSLLAFGKAPRTSATTLAVLTVPTILARHAFWETQDEEEKRNRRNGFVTNIALLGGLFITSVDTAGKPGLKWRAEKAAHTANKKVQQALPTKSETEKFTSKAQDWFGDAADKVTEYAQTAADYYEDNKDDWISSAQDTAKKAQSTISDYASQVQDYISDNADDWLDAAQSNAKTAKKSVVKAASKAQSKADDALERAQSASGRAAKKAEKQYGKLQKDADKALNKAQKKLKKKVDF